MSQTMNTHDPVEPQDGIPTRFVSTPGAARLAYEQPERDTAALMSAGGDPLSRALSANLNRKEAAARREQERVAAMTPAEKRTDAAYRNPALHDREHPEHAAALQELRAATAAEEDSADPDVRGSWTIEDRRSAYGINPPNIVEPLREQWSQDQESAWLDHAHASGWTPAVVKSMHAWYVDRGQLRAGDFSAEDIQDFRDVFESRIGKAAVDLLVDWHSSEVRGGRA